MARPTAFSPPIRRAYADLPVAQQPRETLPTSEQPCPPRGDENRCIYRDVLSADARLVAAYSAASRDGVSVGTLAAIRRRWVQARALSLARPDEAIRRYDDLADALDDAGRDGPQ